MTLTNDTLSLLRENRVHTQSEAEWRVYRWLRRSGYGVMAKGWPDFLAVNLDDPRAIRFIEVKTLEDELSPYQRAVRDVLRLQGIDVEVLSPYWGHVQAHPDDEPMRQVHR